MNSPIEFKGRKFNLAEAKSRAGYWNAVLADQFEGRTITKARYLTPEEADKNFGWESTGVVFFFDDGSDCVVSQDDEGNGAGALLTSNSDNPIIPVV